MSRRCRRTTARAAAWCATTILLAAGAAALAVVAYRDQSTAEIVGTVATAYLAVITLPVALTYGCSVAWHYGRRPRQRPVPTGRPAYTPQALSALRMQAAERDHARQAAAEREGWPNADARHAAPQGEHQQSARLAPTVPMPVVDAATELLEATPSWPESWYRDPAGIGGGR